MTGDQAAGLVWGFGSLVLVGSALAARRLPVAKLGMMALAWAAIFAVAISLALLWQMIRHRPGGEPDRTNPAEIPSGPSHTV